MVIPRHRRRASFAGLWVSDARVDPDGCNGGLDRAKRKIGGSRVAIRYRGRVRPLRSPSKVSLYRVVVRNATRPNAYPRQKIADTKPIDQNYCCTVCIVVISAEKID